MPFKVWCAQADSNSRPTVYESRDVPMAIVVGMTAQEPVHPAENFVPAFVPGEARLGPVPPGDADALLLATPDARRSSRHSRSYPALKASRQDPIQALRYEGERLPAMTRDRAVARADEAAYESDVHSGQKSVRTMNCMRRGVPVPTGPLFNTSVMRPKLEVAAILDAGLAKLGWLNRLNASARNLTFAFPPTGVIFST